MAEVVYLATEGAQVFAVLADLSLLDLLTKTGTISGSVFADNADLFGALCLHAEGRNVSK